MATKESISQVVLGIGRILNDIHRSLQRKSSKIEGPVSQEVVEDVLSQFTLWIGSLGAKHHPDSPLSLEHRLRNAPHVERYISGILSRLSGDLSDLRSITTGQKPNRKVQDLRDEPASSGVSEAGHITSSEDDDEGSHSPNTEAGILMAVISDHLKSLFRISILVRKASSEDRFQRAISSQGPTFMAQFDMEYLSMKYPKLNTYALATGMKFSWMVVRLGTANVKRRQFIRYCREHSEKLKAEAAEKKKKSLQPTRAPLPSSSPLPVSLPAPLVGEVVQEDAMSERATSHADGSYLASTKVTSLPLDRIPPEALLSPRPDEDDNISATTGTTACGDSELSLPNLQTLRRGRWHFECPICFSLQSMTRNKAWKAHAFHDLRAYVCTVGKGCDDLMFPDRDSWFKHEMDHHRLQFCCPLCGSYCSQSKDDFRNHLKVHGQFNHAQLSALQTASGQPPQYLKETDCPFCDVWGEAGNSLEHRQDKSDVPLSTFKAHVAHHQEQVSIFVPPRATEEEGREGKPNPEMAEAVAAMVNLCLEREKRLFSQYRHRILESRKLLLELDDDLCNNIVKLEAMWSRIASQIEFSKHVSGTLNVEHCRIHTDVLETLRDVFAKPLPSIDPTHVISSITSGLHNVLEHIQRWLSVFEPVWFLIFRVDSHLVDSEIWDLSEVPPIPGLSSIRGHPGIFDPNAPLRFGQSLRSVLKTQPGEYVPGYFSEKSFNWSFSRSIFLSTTLAMQMSLISPATHLYLVDSIPCSPGVDMARVRADAEALGNKLQNFNPWAFGLPICDGFVEREGGDDGNSRSLNFLFYIPLGGMMPFCLRTFLVPSTKSPPRSVQFILRMAKQLSRAVHFIHALDILHGNIRPESAFVVSHPEKTVDKFPPTVFLLGFRFCPNNVDFEGVRKQDESWERNLYQHPSRQGLLGRKRYTVRHDVYSFGVLLLEIAMSGFVSTEDARYDLASDSFDTGPSAALGLTIDDIAPQENVSKPDYRVKDHLVSLARSQLPQTMGAKYAEVVLACLTCLDENNTDLGSESDLEDENGVTFGIRFVDKIIWPLSEI